MATLFNQGTVFYTPENGETASLVSNTTATNYDLSYALSIRSGASLQTYLTGDTIRRVIEVNNTGSGTLTDVVVTSDLAGGALAFEADSVSAFLDNGETLVPVLAAVTLGENTVSFAFEEPLAGGERILLVYHVVVTEIAGAEIVATDTVTAFEGGTERAEISAEDSVTLTRAVLEISKSAPEFADVGETILYVFTLTNHSEASVNIDALSDKLPANFTFTALTMKVNGAPVALVENVDFVIGEDGTLKITPSFPVSIPALGVAIVEITGVVTA